MDVEALKKQPGIAWAFRLAEIEGHPNSPLMAYAYTQVYAGTQHIPEAKRTPEAISAAADETEAMQKRAKELTAELDDAGLIDWSVCDAQA